MGEEDFGWQHIHGGFHTRPCWKPDKPCDNCKLRLVTVQLTGRPGSWMCEHETKHYLKMQADQRRRDEHWRLENKRTLYRQHAGKVRG